VELKIGAVVSGCDKPLAVWVRSDCRTVIRKGLLLLRGLNHLALRQIPLSGPINAGRSSSALAAQRNRSDSLMASPSPDLGIIAGNLMVGSAVGNSTFRTFGSIKGCKRCYCVVGDLRMRFPLVSAIIPIHNCRKYWPRVGAISHTTRSRGNNPNYSSIIPPIKLGRTPSNRAE